MESEDRKPVVIVSGAAGGLGRVCAELVSGAGAAVGLIDVSPRVENVSNEINQNGGESVPLIGDITDSARVEEMVEKVFSTYGNITGLINAAAVYRDLPYREFTEIPEKEWDRVMSVNVKGLWLLTKAVVHYMKKSKFGSIVNVSSSTFFAGTAGMGQYVASKGAIIGLTRTMARELGKYGIRANCVAPGLMPTEATLARAPKERMDDIAKVSSLGRLATPQEVSEVIWFLVSERSMSLTGQTILADAGGLFY